LLIYLIEKKSPDALIHFVKLYHWSLTGLADKMVGEVNISSINPNVV
jgi:hypothetical protein